MSSGKSKNEPVNEKKQKASLSRKNIKKQMIGSVNFFEFTQGKKKLVFLDSFNFFKHSLKEIA